MRMQKSVKNIFISIISNVLNILIGLIAQAIFLKTLGEEYLGLNGILSNTLSILAIAELGLSSAIIYKLYKPVAEKDYKQIIALMQFYKKTYYKIILTMIIIIFAIAPFLPKIVGNLSEVKENLFLIYSLFSLDIIISYLLAYKKSILYADQNEYLTSIVHICYLFLMNVLQIIFLLITRNYIIYLVIKIISRIFENVVIYFLVKKKYPFLNKKDTVKINADVKNDITKNMRALFSHKLSGFIVNGTDTILISYFLGGAVIVGYYSNYALVISAVTTVFNQVFVSLTYSIGNLLTEDNTKKNYLYFKRIQFLNFWLFTFAATCIFCMMESFINIWIGKEYILPRIVLIVLVINFFMQGMRRTFMSFKEAAGIFYVDRYVPILEAIVNIISSIILLKIFGLSGVFMGTIISTLVVYLISYPEYVYIPLFKQKYFQYIIGAIKYIIAAFIVTTITYFITSYIKTANPFFNLLLITISSFTISNFLLFLLFIRNDEFRYYKNLLFSFLKKKKKNNVI